MFALTEGRLPDSWLYSMGRRQFKKVYAWFVGSVILIGAQAENVMIFWRVQRSEGQFSWVETEGAPKRKWIRELLPEAREVKSSTMTIVISQPTAEAAEHTEDIECTIATSNVIHPV